MVAIGNLGNSLSYQNVAKGQPEQEHEQVLSPVGEPSTLAAKSESVITLDVVIIQEA